MPRIISVISRLVLRLGYVDLRFGLGCDFMKGTTLGYDLAEIEIMEWCVVRGTWCVERKFGVAGETIAAKERRELKEPGSAMAAASFAFFCGKSSTGNREH